MVAVIGLGFVLIGYLVWVAPESAPTLIPLILAIIGPTLVLIQKQTAVEAKVEEVKDEAKITNVQVARSINVSTENAHAIAVVAAQQGYAIETVAQKVDSNTVVTETVHSLVNARDTDLRRELSNCARLANTDRSS